MSVSSLVGPKFTIAQNRSPSAASLACEGERMALAREVVPAYFAYLEICKALAVVTRDSHVLSIPGCQSQALHSIHSISAHL
jgi:hypothetical protein